MFIINSLRKLSPGDSAYFEEELAKANSDNQNRLFVIVGDDLAKDHGEKIHIANSIMANFGQQVSDGYCGKFACGEKTVYAWLDQKLMFVGTRSDFEMINASFVCDQLDS